jgi:spore germination protein KC
MGGCTHDMNKEEIDSINMALVLGIDYKDEEYRICALYSSGGGESSGAGAGPGKEEIVKGKGKTAYEALEDLKLNDKKNLTLAQTGMFLIGEERPRRGSNKALIF